MCTLTVWRDAARLIVTMNRDDAAARPGAPPRLWTNEGAVFAVPVDLEAGAWIGVSAPGVLPVCLIATTRRAKANAPEEASSWQPWMGSTQHAWPRASRRWSIVSERPSPASSFRNRSANASIGTANSLRVLR